MAYAIVRTDNMTGSYDGSYLRSCKFYDGEGNPAELQNGHIAALRGLVDGEREIYKTVAPTADDTAETIVIAASPEVMYDEHKHNLNEFVNKAGAAFRGYLPHRHNTISMTAEAFNGTPNTDDFVTIEAGKTTMKPVATAADAAVVGRVIGIETVDNDTYYVIELS